MPVLETFNITPRKLYTEKIIELLKNDNVVIVLGLRRSGKSCIAKQLESELQEKYGNKIELVRHNFEKITKNRISGDYLIKHFQERHVEGTPCFILLDELTHVVEWEKVINHICQHSDCKLVLFSSNRRVLSSKLTAGIHRVPGISRDYAREYTNMPKKISSFRRERLYAGGDI